VWIRFVCVIPKYPGSEVSRKLRCAGVSILSFQYLNSVLCQTSCFLEKNFNSCKKKKKNRKNLKNFSLDFRVSSEPKNNLLLILSKELRVHKEKLNSCVRKRKYKTQARFPYLSLNPKIICCWIFIKEN